MGPDVVVPDLGLSADICGWASVIRYPRVVEEVLTPNVVTGSLQASSCLPPSVSSSYPSSECDHVTPS